MLVRPLGALTACAVLGACSISPPDHGTESAIAEATGLPGAVAFQTIGGPIDEPDVPSAALPQIEAVRRAVSTDPGLQSALARVRIALAEARQARLLPNPVLNLAFRFSTAGAGAPVVDASLAQDLISILQMPGRVSAADNRLRQASAEALVVALDTVAEVQEAYAAVQADDAAQPILDARVRALEQLLTLERARLAAGESTRHDLAALEAQRIELDVDADDLHLRQRMNRLRLARLIGEPSGAAAWTVDVLTPPVLMDAPESAWVAQALASRPEVQAINWRLCALGDEAALTRWLPFDGSEGGVDSERDGDWTVGPSIALPLPIFDLGQARSERAMAEVIEARHDLTRVQRQTVEDVRREFTSMHATVRTLRRVREELIPAHERRTALADQAARAGVADRTEWLIAEGELQSARARAIALEHDAAVAQIRLQRAAGGAAAARGTALGNPSLSPTTNIPRTTTMGEP